MTNEQAINNLKIALSEVNQCLDMSDVARVPDEAYVMKPTLEIAIETLKKQIPKKPKISGVTTKDGVFHPINGIDGVPYELCPSCEVNLCTTGILAEKRMRYCEHCGQAIDWSE